MQFSYLKRNQKFRFSKTESIVKTLNYKNREFSREKFKRI